MKALEKARSMLELADTDLMNSTPNLERSAARRELGLAWLEYARTQQALGVPDPVPEPPKPPPPTNRPNRFPPR